MKNDIKWPAKSAKRKMTKGRPLFAILWWCPASQRSSESHCACCVTQCHVVHLCTDFKTSSKELTFWLRFFRRKRRFEIVFTFKKYQQSTFAAKLSRFESSNSKKSNFPVLDLWHVLKVPTADLFEHWIAERRLREYCHDKAVVGEWELSGSPRTTKKLWSFLRKLQEVILSSFRKGSQDEENEEVLFVIEHRPRIAQIDSDPTLWGHSFARRRGEDFEFARLRDWNIECIWMYMNVWTCNFQKVATVGILGTSPGLMWELMGSQFEDATLSRSV